MGLSGKHILSIDDDIEFQTLIKKILENVGMKVYLCATLKESAELMREVTPDIILLDLNLEYESGNKFLKIKQKKPSLSNIPVVICSSENKREAIEKVVSLGSDGYVLKPIKQTLLIQKLKQALKGRTKLAYKFRGKRPTVCVEAKCSVIGLSETVSVIRSNIKFAKGQELSISAELFNELNVRAEKLKAVKDGRPSLTGQYDTPFSMTGLNEEEMDKIRTAKAGWRK
ncbi:MAG: response regulator [Bacteriovoracaceae bacterium]|nr:response regulator [Bacteriovoracaceae bacterium]